MKRKKYGIVLLLLIILCITVRAQDTLSTYKSSYDGRKYDVRITAKADGVYRLWIDGVTFDSETPVGGIVLNEKNYFLFVESLIQAKKEYLELMNKSIEMKSTTVNKSLRIFSYSDAFFLKTHAINLHYGVSMNFDVKSSVHNGELKYYLVVTTGKLTSGNILGQSSDGFGYIFSSSEDIDTFLEAISSEKINAFLEKTAIQKIKIDNRKINTFKDSTSWFTGKSLGAKVQFVSTFGSNNFDPGLISLPYSLVESSVSTKSCFDFGIFYQLRKDRFFVQPELLYNTGEYEYTLRFMDSHNQIVKAQKEVYISSCNIPLTLGYTVMKSKYANINLIGGSDFYFNIGTREKYTNLISYSQLDVNELKPSIAPVSLAAFAGVGFDFGQFTLDCRYRIQRNSYCTTLNNNKIDGQIVINTFQIGLGVRVN